MFGPSLLILSILTTPAAHAAHAAADSVTIEYVGHASFIIQSPHGTRIAIDPYNSFIWMGYEYPRDVVANAVLVSHAHYDHDATYYFPDAVPSFRLPGSYALGDIRIVGIQGRHGGAERMRQRGLSGSNVIWVLETGGLRIAHTGDNDTLSDDELRQMGRIDVLLTSDVSAAQTPATSSGGTSTARRIIPMHYRLPGLSLTTGQPRELDTLLAGAQRIRTHTSNTLVLTAGQINGPDSVFVLQPSPGVQSWSPAVRSAMAAMRRALTIAADSNTTVGDSVGVYYEQATRLAPQLIAAYRGLSRYHVKRGNAAQAITVLEQGLTIAWQDDWATTMQARAELARLYVAEGRRDLATEQYRHIEAHEHLSLTLRREAEDFLRPAK